MLQSSGVYDITSTRFDFLTNLSRQTRLLDIKPRGNVMMSVQFFTPNQGATSAKRLHRLVVGTALCVFAVSAAASSAAPVLLPDPARAATPQDLAQVAKESGVREFGPHLRTPETGAATFTVRSGQTLREVLDEWGQRAGWDLSWEITGKQMVLGAGASFTGPIEDVVDALINALGGEVAHLQVEMHQANRMIRVSHNTRGRKE